jgi:histidinol phosphatase-like PHP family hydrolase
VTGIHDNHNHLVANGDALAMVRAAEAAGIAGFAFTEHIFHLDEPRVASRYLGTRWDGELEGPPIGVDRYLAEIAAAAQAVPAVSVGSSSTGPTIPACERCRTHSCRRTRATGT